MSMLKGNVGNREIHIHKMYMDVMNATVCLRLYPQIRQCKNLKQNSNNLTYKIKDDKKKMIGVTKLKSENKNTVE